MPQLRRPTRVRRCVAAIVLCTKMDAQCDKLPTVVGRTKSTTVATVAVPLLNFSKSRVLDKVLDGSTLIFGDTESPNIVGQADGSLSDQNHLDPCSLFDRTLDCDRLTDRRTDGDKAIANTAQA